MPLAIPLAKLFKIWKVDKKCYAKYYKAHRTICEVFKRNDDPINKTICNHINGNIFDNRAMNLEWVTPSENALHAHKSGLSPNTRKIEQRSADGKVIAIHDDYTKCAIAVGLSYPTIRRIVKGLKSRVTTDTFHLLWSGLDCHLDLHNRELQLWRHYTFRQRLIARARLVGCYIHIVDEHYTSRTCTACGHLNAKNTKKSKTHSTNKK